MGVLRPSRRQIGIAVGLVVSACALVGAGGSLGAAAVPPPPPTTLTVTKSGLQQGLVTDSEDQINCGIDCAGTYAAECAAEDPDGICTLWVVPTIELATTVPSGFATVWSGHSACNGASTCQVQAQGTVQVHYDDPSAPSVSLTAPSPGPAHGSITLVATASDPQTGINRVEFRVRGNLVGTDTSGPYSVGLDTTTLGDGSASVEARAFNNDSDATSTSTTITIDNTAPTITVSSGPNSQTFGPGTTQTWTFSSSDTTTGPPTVQCSVVAQGASPSFGACSGSGTHAVSSLPDGAYTFTVRATDGATNQTTQTRSFTIDATPPDTTIVTGPANGSAQASTTATFAFTATESNSTFRCRVYLAALSPPAFTDCSAAGSHTASGFPPGTYTFEVAGVDAYGNTDASPAKRTFTVDNVAPNTRLTRGPKARTFAKAASFRFAATEKGTRFQCKLDKGAWTTCRSPKSYKRLKKGRHTFQVRAIDAVGNVDKTPANKTWLVRSR